MFNEAISAREEQERMGSVDTLNQSLSTLSVNDDKPKRLALTRQNLDGLVLQLRSQTLSAQSAHKALDQYQIALREAHEECRQAEEEIRSLRLVNQEMMLAEQGRFDPRDTALKGAAVEIFTLKQELKASKGQVADLLKGLADTGQLEGEMREMMEKTVLEKEENKKDRERQKERTKLMQARIRYLEEELKQALIKINKAEV